MLFGSFLMEREVENINIVFNVLKCCKRGRQRKRERKPFPVDRKTFSSVCKIDLMNTRSRFR